MISPAALLVNVTARISSGKHLLVLDQMRDTMRKHTRFARPGSSHNQDRPDGGQDGLLLLLIETVKEIGDGV
ncbi:MAG: hypothetical protein R2845_06395 [Thermomicrobiales bacterium]